MFKRRKPEPNPESNIDPDPVTFTERTRLTVHFSEKQWDRVVRSARRRNIEPELYVVQASTEEPMSMKMVNTEWVKGHLQGLAKMLPQVGPLREKIEQLIESLG